MRSHTDQRGNVVPWDEFLQRISESVLANVIAFDRAGVPQGSVTVIVGRDGGTVMGAGAMFQTPVVNELTEQEGNELFETYKQLADRYHAGEISADRLQEISDKNNVSKKVDLIKKAAADGDEGPSRRN